MGCWAGRLEVPRRHAGSSEIAESIVDANFHRLQQVIVDVELEAVFAGRPAVLRSREGEPPAGFRGRDRRFLLVDYEIRFHEIADILRDPRDANFRTHWQVFPSPPHKERRRLGIELCDRLAVADAPDLQRHVWRAGRGGDWGAHGRRRCSGRGRGRADRCWGVFQ